MKKKTQKTIAPAPALPDFRIRFLRVLESSYQADPLVARILKDKALREECAALLWHTVNDTRERLAGQTTERRDFWINALDDAIRGAKAMEFIYTKLDNKPHLAEYLATLRSDLLLKRQAVDTAFASPKVYGRDRDWFIVLYAKNVLESRLQATTPNETIPNETMANLLNAADFVCGRKPAPPKTQVEPADVWAGLHGLHHRTYERLLPFYQQMLSQHFPQGSDLPVRPL